MEYKPLNTETDEIRLLTILPTKEGSKRWREVKKSDDPEVYPFETVQCTMENFSMKDVSNKFQRFGEGKKWALDPSIKTQKWLKEHSATHRFADMMMKTTTWRFKWGDYHALSYLWGDGRKTRKILVNGKEFTVNENLEMALRMLWRVTDLQFGTKLWVDAISINQMDLAERESQVKRMRMLYERSLLTLTWLGPATPNIRQGMNIFLAVAKKNLSSSTVAGADKMIDDIEENPEYFEHNSWRGLHEFLTRPYWSRLWILQEIALSRDRVVVICGPQMIDWADVYWGADMMCLFQETIVKRVRGEMAKKKVKRDTAAGSRARAAGVPVKKGSELSDPEQKRDKVDGHFSDDPGHTFAPLESSVTKGKRFDLDHHHIIPTVAADSSKGEGSPAEVRSVGEMVVGGRARTEGHLHGHSETHSAQISLATAKPEEVEDKSTDDSAEGWTLVKEEPSETTLEEVTAKTSLTVVDDKSEDIHGKETSGAIPKATSMVENPTSVDGAKSALGKLTLNPSGSKDSPSVSNIPTLSNLKPTAKVVSPTFTKRNHKPEDSLSGSDGSEDEGPNVQIEAEPEGIPIPPTSSATEIPAVVVNKAKSTSTDTRPSSRQPIASPSVSGSSYTSSRSSSSGSDSGSESGSDDGYVDEDDIYLPLSRLRDIYGLTDDAFKNSALLIALGLSRFSEQSDLRDKIYGILGLLPEGIAELLEPSYEIPHEQVFAEFARAAIKSQKNIEFFRITGLDVNIDKKPSAPSWIPDFDGEGDGVHASGFMRTDFCASGDLEVVASFSENNKEVTCKGILVDIVDGMSRKKAKNEIVQTKNSKNGYGTEAAAYEALWKTFIVWSEVDTEPRSEDGIIHDLLTLPWEKHDTLRRIYRTPYYDLFDKWRRLNQDLLIYGKPLRSFFHEVLPSTHKYRNEFGMIQTLEEAVLAHDFRKLTVTEGGRVGWVPGYCKKGDVIAVLLGCTSLLALRKVGARWRLIGEAFVHGVMEGQALEWEKEGKVKFEDFTIY